MADDLDNLGLSPAANFSVKSVNEIKTTSNKLPSPSLVADAVGPEVLLIKWRESGRGITHEATGGVRVHAKQKWNEEMVRIPEGFE